MDPGFHGPRWDVESVGDVGEGQAEVMMEDQDGTLLEREPAKGSVKLVPIVDRQDLLRSRWLRHGHEADVRFQPTAASRLGVALVGEDPMEPGFEAIRIAQRSKLAPSGDERGLHGVLRLVPVAQDPNRDRHASVADRSCESVEGLDLAPHRTVDERPMHVSPLRWRPVQMDRSHGRARWSPGGSIYVVRTSLRSPSWWAGGAARMPIDRGPRATSNQASPDIAVTV